MCTWASQVVQLEKNSPANAGDAGDLGSIPGLGSSREGKGNPLQYSCLDRGARWATVHEVTKSRTQVTECTHTSMCTWGKTR